MNQLPDELQIISRNRFCDQRGYFSELYNEKTFEKYGLPSFLQDNYSLSGKGVIRGLHWQQEPYAQGKLVSCLRGAIFDVVVDMRLGSSTRFQSYGIEITEESDFSFWIPKGFAHGFQALSENTLVVYKVDSFWNKESERAVNPLDPALGIRWPIPPGEISEKDLKSPNLDSYS